MKESKLQKAIINYCRANGIYVVNIYGAGFCSKGVPDLLLCVNGIFIAMECKVGDNQLQPDQIIHAKRIEMAGGRWCSPRCLEDAVAVIKDVQHGTVHNFKRE